MASRITSSKFYFAVISINEQSLYIYDMNHLYLYYYIIEFKVDETSHLITTHPQQHTSSCQPAGLTKTAGNGIANPLSNYPDESSCNANGIHCPLQVMC